MKKVNREELVSYGIKARKPERAEGKTVLVSDCPFERNWEELLETLDKTGTDEFVYYDKSTGTTEFIFYLINNGWCVADNAEIIEEYWDDYRYVDPALVFKRK